MQCLRSPEWVSRRVSNPAGYRDHCIYVVFALPQEWVSMVKSVFYPTTIDFTNPVNQSVVHKHHVDNAICLFWAPPLFHYSTILLGSLPIYSVCAPPRVGQHGEKCILSHNNRFYKPCQSISQLFTNTMWIPVAFPNTMWMLLPRQREHCIYA